MTDFELQRQYVQSGSETAFSELVKRHIDMVYAACVRRLGNRQDAEDATQAVFIALARKASSIPERATLAGWLYRAAGYVAGEVAQEQTVQGARNGRSGPRPGNQASQDASEHDIDHVLSQLNAGERHAIVLRYLEGRSFREVASEMRLSEEAARKRVSRGLERLRGLLRTADGNAFSMALVEQLFQASLHPAPRGLISSTTHSGLAGWSASSGGAVLAKGAVLAMALSKAKTIAIVVAVLLLAGTGVVGTYYASHRQNHLVVIIPAVTAAPVTKPTGDWRPGFYQTYALKPDENVKVVAPPLTWERQMFFTDDCHSRGMTGWSIGSNSLLGLEWDGAAEHWTSIGHYGTLEGALQVLGVKPYEIDSSIPLNLPFPGDWVVRKGSSMDQRMKGLGTIVSQKLTRSVHFERRKLPREVLEVDGPPLPISSVVDLADGVSKTQADAFVQQGSLNDLLSQLTNRLTYKLENHVPDTGVTFRWHNNAVSRNAPEAVLKNLAAQTSLRFSHHIADVDVWCMIEDGTDGLASGK